jgi:glyoxylase-like metal-dependent hydrolase (beta-lactamase superfamily II)
VTSARGRARLDLGKPGGSAIDTVNRIRPGIWSIPVPMPGPLRYVYVYVVEGPSGLLLVDAGPPDKASLAAVLDGIQAVGAEPSDVDGILFTHAHVDHYGGAALLQQATGAWLAVHPAELDRLAAEATTRTDDLAPMLQLFALDEAEVAATLDLLEPRLARSRLPALAVRPLADGDTFPLGDGTLVAAHTPGHATGHTCFVHEAAGVVFSGDHVLSTTTPNVGHGPDESGNPLAEYLGALERVEQLGEMLSLPGHEERVPVGPRARALIGHHEARLAEAAVAVQAGHNTVRAVAERMTWSLPFRAYGPLDRMMALREAFAHLIVLESRGDVVRAHESPLRWNPAYGTRQ